MNIVDKVVFSELLPNIVYCTNDYESLWLNQLAGSRVVKPSHLKAVMDSIDEHGQIAEVIMSHEGVLIDGQVRLAATEELGIPVQFVVCKIDDPSKAQSGVNSGSRNWIDIDYLRSGKELGIDGYNVVVDFVDEYQIKPSVLDNLGITMSINSHAKRGLPITLVSGIADASSRLGVYSMLRERLKDITGTAKEPHTYFRKSMNRIFSLMNSVDPRSSKGELLSSYLNWETIAKNMENQKIDKATKKLRELKSMHSCNCFLEDCLNHRNRNGKTSAISGRV